MFGWINDCTEQLVITHFGLSAWHTIKAKANCKVSDYGFVRHQYYPDESTVSLVVAASEVLNIPVDGVLEAFGKYFMEFTRKNGYEKLLSCQGSTLRLWLSNVNSLHDHLKSSLPQGFVAPVFWCEDDVEGSSEGEESSSTPGAEDVPELSPSSADCSDSSNETDSESGMSVGDRPESSADDESTRSESTRTGNDNEHPSILLHYYSQRGSLLVPLVVGVVKEVARFHFNVEINMERLRMQGDDDGSEYTTWRISAVEKGQQWKLTQSRMGGGHGTQQNNDAREAMRRSTMRTANGATGGCPHKEKAHANKGDMDKDFSDACVDNDGAPLRCPFSGVQIRRNSAQQEQTQIQEEQSPEAEDPSNDECEDPAVADDGGSDDEEAATVVTPSRAEPSYSRRVSSLTDPLEEEDCCEDEKKNDDKTKEEAESVDMRSNSYTSGMSTETMKAFFPFHVLVDRDFTILQVGSSLPSLLAGVPSGEPSNDTAEKNKTSSLQGRFIGDVLRISRPVLSGWDWTALRKLSDQIFFLVPAAQGSDAGASTKFGPSAEKGTATTTTTTTLNDVVPTIKFKCCMTELSPTQVLLVLSPDAKNIEELHSMDLTMSDLPVQSFQRDAVFLGEHIASEVRSAHVLDKLSKRLENEKNLSNTLLYNMLPRSVADELRRGRTVEPMHYDHVTLFFSDVVGFTSICDKLEPWDVIDMLNQLYSVMDHLAEKFGLYKVETIGDAYMCCSGLPVPDKHHAENIANYALAVMECVKHVQNPVTGEPIRLRIGIHTGHCMGGVVGTLTPHYCLFGDMVNVTARHESTGLPGKIQCSSVLYGRLKHFSPFDTKQYTFAPRGLVEMKGKGECYTYWLEGGTDQNATAGPTAIQTLYGDVETMLKRRKWKKRRYFRRGSMFDANSVLGGSDHLTMWDSVASISVGNTAMSSQGECDVAGESIDGSDAASDAVGRERELDMLDEYIRNDDPGQPQPQQPLAVLHDGIDIDAEDVAESSRGRWHDVEWDPNLNHEELVWHVGNLLTDILSECMSDPEQEDPPHNMPLLETQIHSLVLRISTLYHENHFHNWRHACHVLLNTSVLVELLQQQDGSDSGIRVDPDPWTRFAAVFAALIHDVKHKGVPNQQLEVEGHVLTQVYDTGSCQERHSMHLGLTIFAEDFPELSRAVLMGCPQFLRLVSAAVLATDISSRERQRKLKDHYESIIQMDVDKDACSGDDQKAFRTEVSLEQIILLADVGHCSQKHSTFRRWNRALYKECLGGHLAGRGPDPRGSWYDGQIGFLENYVLPLAERCERLMPRRCGLKEGVEVNLKMWAEGGREWTETMVKELAPDPDGKVQFRRWSNECDQTSLRSSGNS